jgi:hypothetical protein
MCLILGVGLRPANGCGASVWPVEAQLCGVIKSAMRRAGWRRSVARRGGVAYTGAGPAHGSVRGRRSAEKATSIAELRRGRDGLRAASQCNVAAAVHLAAAGQAERSGCAGHIRPGGGAGGIGGCVAA